jgi:hypothetical protein
VGRRLRFGLLQFELTLGSVGGLEDTRSHGWMDVWMDGWIRLAMNGTENEGCMHCRIGKGWSRSWMEGCGGAHTRTGDDRGLISSRDYEIENVVLVVVVVVVIVLR